jgi:short-subunit dehydrogenase
MSAMSLENRWALVTGGNGGIGSKLVGAMVERGMQVTVADLDAKDCPKNAAMIPVDLSRSESVRALGAQLRESPPDVLVNLAGLNAFGGFGVLDQDRLQALMQVNLLAPMQLANAVLPAMTERGSGHIVNVGSVLAEIALPYFAAYAASKAGVERFSDALRREVAGRGITVTYVAPRAVRTPMNDGPISLFNERSGATEDSAERVAGIILNAIDRKRERVTVGFPEKFFVKINALFPRIVDRALVRNRRLAEDVLAAQTS